MPDKRYFLIGVIIVVLLGLGIIGFLFFKSRTVSNAFVGNLSRLEGSSIFVNGKYKIEEDAYLPEGEIIEAKIVITSETKFKRIALNIPSEEELKKTGGRFMVDDLKKETNDVDFEVFKKDAGESSPISLEVKSKSNIWGKSKFEAREIIYRLAVFP